MLKYRLLFTLDPERDLAPLRAEGQSDGGAGRQNPLPSKPKRTHCLLNAPVPCSPHRGWAGSREEVASGYRQGKLAAGVGTMGKRQPPSFGRRELRIPFYRAPPADMEDREQTGAQGPCP